MSSWCENNPMAASFIWHIDRPPHRSPRLPTSDQRSQRAPPQSTAPSADGVFEPTESPEPGALPPLWPHRSPRSPKKSMAAAPASIYVGCATLSKADAKLRPEVPPRDKEEAPSRSEMGARHHCLSEGALPVGFLRWRWGDAREEGCGGLRLGFRPIPLLRHHIFFNKRAASKGRELSIHNSGGSTFYIKGPRKSGNQTQAHTICTNDLEKNNKKAIGSSSMTTTDELDAANLCAARDMTT
jgi:hypothetical protein